MFESLEIVNFTPVSAFVGGLVIGLAALWMMLAQGRIAGVSGICAGVFRPRAGGNLPWQIAFLLGLVMAGATAGLWAGEGISSYGLSRSQPALIIAGLLVGFGTRLGSGCTSGHGICGLARLSPRSMVATGPFMVSGFVVAGLITNLAGGAL